MAQRPEGNALYAYLIEYFDDFIEAERWNVIEARPNATRPEVTDVELEVQSIPDRPAQTWHIEVQFAPASGRVIPA